jgi:hypothetical protein
VTAAATAQRAQHAAAVAGHIQETAQRQIRDSHVIACKFQQRQITTAAKRKCSWTEVIATALYKENEAISCRTDHASDTVLQITQADGILT